MDVYASSPRGAAPGPAPARPRPSRLDAGLLALAFLPFALGMILFGGVRVWLMLPLSMAAFLALGLFWVRTGASLTVLRLPPGGLAFGLLLLYAAVQAAGSQVPWDARVKAIGMTGAASALFLWTSLAGRRNRWKILLGLALILISAVAWYAVIQHSRGSRVVIHMLRPPGYGMRASGTFFCPNHFANMAAMGMCLSLALLFTPEAGLALKLVAGYTFALLGYPLLLTQSRTGVGAALLGLGALGLLGAWRRGARVLALAVVLVPLVLGGAAWGAWRYGPEMRERIGQAVQGFETGEDWRLRAWIGTLEMIRERPLWGHGGGSYRYLEPRYQTYSWQQTAVYAHNEYLQALAEYGVVGAALFAAAICSGGLVLLVRVKRSRSGRNAMLAAGCLSVWVCGLAHAMLDFNFHILANAHFLILTAGVAFACLYEDGELRARPISPGLRLGLRTGGLVLSALLLGASFRIGAGSAVSESAETARRRGRLERAERLFRLAIRLDSGAWEPRLRLAQTLQAAAVRDAGPDRRGRLEEAMRLYEDGLRIQPFDVAGWYGLGQIHSFLGDDGRALEHLRRASGVYPLFPYYHTRVGVQLYRMGRWEEALESFRTALRHDPGDATARLHVREIERRLQRRAQERESSPAP